MLYDQNIKCDCTLTGPQAIKLVESRLELLKSGEAPMYQIVFLDYSMPEMDGPQVALGMQKIIAQSGLVIADEDQPYVCCFTAYDKASFKSSALEAGMHRFLKKPMKLAELNEIIKLKIKDRNKAKK